MTAGLLHRKMGAEVHHSERAKRVEKLPKDSCRIQDAIHNLYRICIPFKPGRLVLGGQKPKRMGIFYPRLVKVENNQKSGRELVS
jgi:hypothetical protein